VWGRAMNSTACRVPRDQENTLGLDIVCRVVNKHVTKLLLDMSHSVVDTPRPFKPSTTQRDIKQKLSSALEA
jgi:hypothetical protein